MKLSRNIEMVVANIASSAMMVDGFKDVLPAG